MNRRQCVSVLLFGTATAGCMSTPSDSPLSSQEDENSSVDTHPVSELSRFDATFTDQVNHPTSPSNPPHVTVDGDTITIIGSVQLANSCYRPVYGGSSYNSSSHTLSVVVGSVDDSDPDVACLSEISFGTYQYRVEAQAQIDEIVIDHPRGVIQIDPENPPPKDIPVEPLTPIPANSS